MTTAIKKEEGWLITIIKKQGTSFILLALAVFFLQKELAQIRKDLLSCEQEKIELLKDQNKSLEKVIIANTVAVTSLKEIIEITKTTKKTIAIDPAFNQK